MTRRSCSRAFRICSRSRTSFFAVSSASFACWNRGSSSMTLITAGPELSSRTAGKNLPLGETALASCGRGMCLRPRRFSTFPYTWPIAREQHAAAQRHYVCRVGRYGIATSYRYSLFCRREHAWSLSHRRLRTEPWPVIGINISEAMSCGLSRNRVHARRTTDHPAEAAYPFGADPMLRRFERAVTSWAAAKGFGTRMLLGTP